MATTIVQKPSVCNKCGKKIGWHQLKSGKWMPVTLQEKCGKIDGVYSKVYYFEYSYGNHNGYTPMHRCECIKCGHTYETKNMRQHSEGNMICTPCMKKEKDK